MKFNAYRYMMLTKLDDIKFRSVPLKLNFYVYSRSMYEVEKYLKYLAFWTI